MDNLEDMLKRERTILNRESFEIFTASTGHEALSLHKAHRMDLMVVSLELPDMSGDMLCASIRKDPDLREVSVIITCSNNAHCIERATHCGANAHITKPFHSSLLTEKVTKLLSIPQRQSYRVLLRISIKGDTGNASFFCSSIDISTSGLMIETDRKLSKGDRLSCSFFLPGYGHIACDGEIVRKMNSADMPRYGIQFRNLDRECQDGIEAFIAGRKAQKS